jgi:hypothetical protein
VNGQLHVPTALPPAERAPCTNLLGGWMGLTAGLDNVERRIFLTLPRLEIWSLCNSSCSQSLYRLRYRSSSSPVHCHNFSWNTSCGQRLKHIQLRWQYKLPRPLLLQYRYITFALFRNTTKLRCTAKSLLLRRWRLTGWLASAQSLLRGFGMLLLYLLYYTMLG